MNKWILTAGLLCMSTLLQATPKTTTLRFIDTDSVWLRKNAQIVLGNSDTKSAVDTVRFNQGGVTFVHPVTQDLLYLQVDGKKVVEFFTDAPEVVFNLKNPIELVRSGELNPKWQAYKQEVRQVGDAYAKPGISEARKQAWMDLYDLITRETFESNKTNYIGIQLLGAISYTLDMKQLDSLMEVVPGSRDSKFLARIHHSKKIEYATRPGVKFVDFKARNADNTRDILLSEFVGKGHYVLVDFWATWCGPCRMEFPYIRQAYQLYKDKGLVVLGVNVWDKYASYAEGIKKYDLIWQHIYASDQRNATDTYGVAGIPHLILFGPDGTILARGLRGEQLLKKLSAYF